MLEKQTLDMPFAQAVKRFGEATVISNTSTQRTINGSIQCGDCINIMKTMQAESMKVVATSPPYNIKNSTGNGLKDGRGGKWPNAVIIEGYDSHIDISWGHRPPNTISSHSRAKRKYA